MQSKSQKRKVILLYHSIGTPPSDDTMQLRVPVSNFQAQMDILRREGWKILTVQELIGAQAEEPMVGVSFDDGYVDQIQAAEILENAGGRGTFFVVPGLLGGKMPGAGCWNRWKLMSPGQIRELFARGHEIGGHSLTHPGPLDQLEPVARRKEISACRERLEELLGRDVNGFSYPHGGYCAGLKKMVALAGYKYACCSRPGPIHLGIDPLGLSRIEIRGHDSLETFISKTSGQGEFWRLLRYRFSRRFRMLP